MKPILLILFLSTFISAQDSWFWQNPWPQGNGLNDVAVIDENKVIAVGHNGVILTTNDGGDSWQINYYDELNAELKSIFFFDDYTGWICGTCYTDYRLGVILKTDDGGNTWERIDILPNADLQEIQFLDKNIGWVSGTNSITRTPYLFKTENGGESWLEEELSSKEVYTCKLHFFDQDTGFVNFMSFSYNLGPGEFLRTTDGGVTWDSLYFGFDNIFFTDNNNGWATHIRPNWGFAWYSIHFTNDGGYTWQEDTTRYGKGDGAIYFTDTLLTSEFGAYDFYDIYNGYYVGESGSICKTKDGGRTWLDKSKIVTTEDLNSVFFLDENRGWAVGGSVRYWWGDEPEVYQNGHVLSTNDGGDSWKYMDYHTDIINYQLRKVLFIDQSMGYSLGFNEDLGWGSAEISALFKTSNAGIPWSWHKILEKESTRFTDFHFIDKYTGLVVGEDNTLLRTTDGGNTWTSRFPSSLDSTSCNWTFNTLYFLNDRDTWISATCMDENQQKNILFKSNDGGITWDSLNFFGPNIVQDIFFINSDTGWFCGTYSDGSNEYGFVSKTTSGGQYYQWTEWYKKTESLSDLFSPLSSIVFVDENAGWMLGDETFYTGDGGENWYKKKDIHSFYSGNNMFFINPKTGWIVGDGGKILKTTTGGMTYVEEESFTKNIPHKLILNQNYPNPFNPTTTISYQLPAVSHVELSIYNILGQKIAALVSERQTAGNHQVEWNASGFASGVYYYQIRTGEGFVRTNKLVLLR